MTKTKNNIDLASGEPVAHTELLDEYYIQGDKYPLETIIETVAGVSGEYDDTTEAVAVWNSRTAKARVELIRTYLADVDATPVANPVSDVSETKTADAETLLKTATKAVGAVDTLRAFNQETEAKEVEDLMTENASLRDKLAMYEKSPEVDAGEYVSEDHPIGARVSYIEKVLGIRRKAG